MRERAFSFIKKNKVLSFFVLLTAISLLTLGIVGRGGKKKGNEGGSDNGNKVALGGQLEGEGVYSISVNSPFYEALDDAFSEVSDEDSLLKRRKRYLEKGAPPFPFPLISSTCPPSISVFPYEVNGVQCRGGIWYQEFKGRYELPLSDMEGEADSKEGSSFSFEGVQELLEGVERFYEKVFVDKWGFVQSQKVVGGEPQSCLKMETLEKGVLSLGFSKVFGFLTTEGKRSSSSVSFAIESRAYRSLVVMGNSSPREVVVLEISASYRDMDL
ncbi:MAG: hypothetical protein QXH08_00155 [Candidatus Hadarchaeales archaeon]